MYIVNLGSKLEDAELFIDNCNCLPICADLTYKVELSQSNWEWNKLLHARRQLPRVGNRFRSQFLNGKMTLYLF
jgi:hypothetical protein